MIYLIKSIGYKEEEEKISTFFLLKIGYTEDSNSEHRFQQYKLHNPTCQILHTIPGGTEEQEKKLHYKFRDLLYGDYGREWFKYSEDMVNYIKSVTIEELDDLPCPPVSRIRYGLAKEIVSNTIILNNILEKSEKVDNFIEKMISDLGKEISKEDRIIEYLVGNSEINQKDLEKYLLKKSGKEIIYSTDEIINKEASDFIRIYDSNKTRLEKLRLLCEYGLSQEALHIVLSQIADSDDVKSFYNTIGPQRLKELGYNVTKIKKELGIVTFSPELLKQEIYSCFKEGNKYTLLTLKNKLASIYSSINYSASPKAKDIENWFEVKPVKIYDIDPETGEKKQYKGYELLEMKKS